MLAELGAQHPLVLETFKEASAALGYDLWALTQQGPEESLNQTDKTQPAILTASIALWRLWLAEGGVRPAYVAGHSLGPAGQGGMAAILGLDDAVVIAACAEAAQGEVVSAVNFNSPGQVVIAGAKAAVERAIEICKAKGAKRALPLPVSVPSHCELMRPAAERFAESIAAIDWQVPQIPLVQNVTASVVSDLGTLKADLLQQLYKPVRWVESIQTLAAQGALQLVECGPGKVLAGLNKRCADGVATHNLNTPDAFAAARAALA
ncbi:malonyl CoA-ACP transacylase [Pseudomonas sp. NZIPFR-PS5]|nr:malonyl CoA-ACP transacylase [Pseudomonas sp. NZIPFR-PS5]